MATQSEEVHVQAAFFTKEGRNAISETPFSLPVSASRDELNNLVNQLLQELTPGAEAKEFDFLVNGELLRGSLEDVVASQNLPIESVVQLEYVERLPPPSLNKELAHSDWVSAVSCSENNILTGCYDNSVCVWTHAGELLACCTEHEGVVKSVAWLLSGDGNHGSTFVSSSQDQDVMIWRWDAASNQATVVSVCKGHSETVESIAPSPDMKMFCSGGWDTHIKIWSAALSDPSDEEEMEIVKKPRTALPAQRPTIRPPMVTLAGHAHPVTVVTWPRPDEVMSAGYDRCIRVWDLTTRITKTVLNGTATFLSLDQQRGGGHLLASGSTDRHIRLWDTRSSATAVVSGSLTSHKNWVRAVAWSPANNHQLVSGSYDNTAKLWDIRSPKTPLYTIAAHEEKLLCLDWSLPQTLATGGADSKLRTYQFQ